MGAGARTMAAAGRICGGEGVTVATPSGTSAGKAMSDGAMGGAMGGTKNADTMRGGTTAIGETMGATGMRSVAGATTPGATTGGTTGGERASDAAGRTRALRLVRATHTRIPHLNLTRADVRACINDKDVRRG